MQHNESEHEDILTTGPMPRIFWVIVGLATALAILLVVFLALRGLQEGQRQAEAQRRQQIAIQLQNAQDAAAAGAAQDALRAYHQVLLLDPDNEQAIGGIAGLFEATSLSDVPPTPAPVPPTPTPTPLNSVELVWADAQALYNAGRWEEAIDRLQRVQAMDRTFVAAQVEEMLYTSYVNLATDKSNAGSLEEAVTLFDYALKLRPQAVEIRQIRDNTAQYVDMLTYWHADWPQVIAILTELYQRNPDYRDVRQRLQQAHLEYANSLAQQSDWCAAAEQYGEAIAVQNGPDLEAQQAEFRTLCEQAPLAVAIEGEAGSADAIGSGPGAGRILYSARDPVDGRYRIYAQPVADGVRPLTLVEDAMHPALRPDGQRLVYRNLDGAQRGLGSYDPATGLQLRFTVYAEDSLPSWNPDGNRLVFASDREGDRRWRIYTAWADGDDNGMGIGYGYDPDWHPQSDRIVFRGCDERGNACGLWTMNSAGGDPLPLTDVPGDAHPVWSADGQTVVFMSQERGGNWDLYRIDTQTGNIVQLTTDPASDGLPAVSPDGSRVAFLSNRAGAWQIWIVPITGGPAHLLAPVNGELPDWLQQKIQWVP